MAAVMLSNPGLPLAVLGNPGKRRRRSKRKNPMSKRTPRFFLRKFKRSKRNPYMHATGYTRGGALWSTGTAPRYARSKQALRDQLEAEGYSVSNITPVRKTGKSLKRRRKHRAHTKKARRGRRKHTMAKTRRRSTKKRLAALRRSRHARRVGRVYSRKVRGRRYSVKVIRARRGHGKRRKVLAARWSGKRGSAIYTALSFGSKRRKGTHVIGFTNPKRRKHRSRRTSHRRNPGIAADYVGGITSAPRTVMSLFKGGNMIKHVGYAAGGAVGTFMIGGVLSAKVIRPLLEKIAPSFAAQVADPNTIAARVVGGLLPYTAAFIIAKLAGKKLGKDITDALLTGGIIASGVELIRPGMVGDLLQKVGLGELPYAGPALAGLGALHGPVCGLGYSAQLAGYYSAPAYQGSAGYEQAPAYQGSAGLRGYVSDKSQRLSGMAGREVLAGTFLDDAADHMLDNNWLTNEGGAADASINDAMASSN
jgi:hypothetical protein